MDENNKESPSDKPNLGIKRISKVIYSKPVSEDEKKKNKDLFYCASGPRIAKVVFTIHTTFLLFCKISLIPKLMGK